MKYHGPTVDVPMGPPASRRGMTWVQEDVRTWLAYGKPWEPWEARCCQVEEGGPWSWQVWYRGQRLTEGQGQTAGEAREQATAARWAAEKAVRVVRSRIDQGWTEAKRARERERALESWRAGRIVMRTSPEQPAAAGGK